MPIKFRCSHCRQFLGISPSKAGELTDCPACGRTVRVPDLDGSIAPLPTARIDPGDAQLAEALHALSRIGESPTRNELSRSVSPTVIANPAAVAAPPAVVAAPAQRHLPAERIAPAPAAQSSADAIPELLFDFEPPIVEPIRRRAQRSPTMELRIVAAILTAVGVFLAGFFTGRAVERRPAGAATNPASVAQPAVAVDPIQRLLAASPAATSQPPAETRGVAGMITWLTADGQSRGDGGARILALPAERPGSPPLSVAGFRAGTVPTERERAVATIRAAGGDYAIADEAGRFALQLPAGRYEVLFVSRHQPRDSTQPLDAPVSQLLSAYFDQPSGLVGSVGVALAPVDFDGTSLHLDHAFTR